jgi:hypothetical protein
MTEQIEYYDVCPNCKLRYVHKYRCSQKDSLGHTIVLTGTLWQHGCPECKGVLGHGKDCSQRSAKNSCTETINGFHGDPDREGKCPFCRLKISYGQRLRRESGRYGSSYRNTYDVYDPAYDRTSPAQSPDIDPHEEEYYDR